MFWEYSSEKPNSQERYQKRRSAKSYPTWVFKVNSSPRSFNIALENLVAASSFCLLSTILVTYINSDVKAVN